MQVTETLSEGLKRAYTVVVPAADIESKRAARLANLGKTLTLPGFPARQDPADRGAPALRHGGQCRGAGGVGHRGDPAGAERARPAAGAAAQGRRAEPRSERRSAKDLEFKVELELLPEITLPDFGTVQLTRMKAEAPAEAVDKALADIAQRNRTLEPITAEELGDRGAAKGEVLTVDYVGRVDGAEFPGGTGKGIEVEIGGTGFIPGFSEQLEGMKPGETRTIEVTFPAEYGVPTLAGKAAKLRCHRQHAEPSAGAGARR